MIIGTRPEAIKMRSLVLEMKSRDIPHKVIYTGQQLDIEQEFFSRLDIPISITLPKRSHFSSLPAEISRQISSLSEIFSSEVDLNGIFVQGDTTTTFASAITARMLRIPVFYLESGLRTFDENAPFPEELNRKLVSQLATMNFTPTKISTQNLLREGISETKILEVGNTVIDSLRITLEDLKKKQGGNLTYNHLNYKLFVSCHRRELEVSERIALAKSLKLIAQDSKNILITFSLHPNPQFSSIFRKELSGIENIVTREGMGYEETISTICESSLVITDSGGIQEEAASLGVPLLIYRSKTERPECLETSTSQLLTPRDNLFADEILRFMSSHPYTSSQIELKNVVGDGFSAVRIVDWLLGRIA